MKSETKKIKELSKMSDDKLDQILAVLKHHGEMLSAILHAQEMQKAQIDQLTITTAKTDGQVVQIAESQDQIADDIDFLVRKAAKHDKDIRELRRVK
jgi:DNA mismatch repair ATPase MutS